MKQFTVHNWLKAFISLEQKYPDLTHAMQYTNCITANKVACIIEKSKGIGKSEWKI